MPTFSYKALQPDGKVATGQIDAAGRNEAMRQIEALSLRPISLKESGGKVNGKSVASKAAVNGAPAAEGAEGGINLSLGGGKINSKILENFTRLLSSLLAAGVPLSRALIILQKEAANPVAKAKWKEIHDLVVDGKTLAEAMSKSPDTFPRVYVAMVEAGEVGGFLDVVLAQIADFQSREKEMRSKMMAALIYPCILLLLASGVVAFLMIFFVPRFTLMFQEFHADLPLITRIIVAISNAIRTYGPLTVIIVVIAVYMVRNWFASATGKRAYEGMMLKLPTVGPLVSQYAMARFCRMLGTLLGAGVPLINGLNVARRSIGNQILVDAVSNSIDRVKEGKGLGESLSECRVLFSGATLEMISVAEESGRLDQELVRLANTTEGELDRQLKTAVAVAEPLMLFVIAGFVGTIFIGMVLPIFTLQQYIK